MPHLRQAARKLLRNPGFTFFAVLTLAIGIGASTAIFSLVDTILLSPLPYPEAGRLVEVLHDAPGLDLDGMGQSDATYLRYRDHNRVFDGIALYDLETATLTGDGESERLDAAAVTPRRQYFLRTVRSPPDLREHLPYKITQDDDRRSREPAKVRVVRHEELCFGG